MSVTLLQIPFVTVISLQVKEFETIDVLNVAVNRRETLVEGSACPIAFQRVIVSGAVSSVTVRALETRETTPVLLFCFTEMA
jgi:hypothetical protein